MTKLIVVDFKEKKVLARRDLNEARPHPDQSCLEKFLHFSQIYPHGLTSVGINTATEGLVLPSHLFTGQPTLLNFSSKFAGTDTKFDEEGLSATLSFLGAPFRVEIPWASVFLIMRAQNNGFRKEWPEALIVLGEQEQVVDVEVGKE